MKASLLPKGFEIGSFVPMQFPLLFGNVVCQVQIVPAFYDARTNELHVSGKLRSGSAISIQPENLVQLKLV